MSLSINAQQYEGFKKLLPQWAPETELDTPRGVMEVDQQRRQVGAQPTTLGAAIETQYLQPRAFDYNPAEADAAPRGYDYTPSPSLFQSEQTDIMGAPRGEGYTPETRWQRLMRLAVNPLNSAPATAQYNAWQTRTSANDAQLKAEHPFIHKVLQEIPTVAGVNDAQYFNAASAAGKALSEGGGSSAMSQARQALRDLVGNGATKTEVRRATSELERIMADNANAIRRGTEYTPRVTDSTRSVLERAGLKDFADNLGSVGDAVKARMRAQGVAEQITGRTMQEVNATRAEIGNYVAQDAQAISGGGKGGGSRRTLNFGGGPELPGGGPNLPESGRYRGMEEPAAYRQLRARIQESLKGPAPEEPFKPNLMTGEGRASKNPLNIKTGPGIPKAGVYRGGEQPAAYRAMAEATRADLEQTFGYSKLLTHADELAAKSGVPEAGGIIRNWMDTTEQMATDVGSQSAWNTARSIVAGDVTDPWFVNAIHRREALTNALETSGVSRDSARNIAQDLFEARLRVKYGVQRVLDEAGMPSKELPAEVQKMILSTKTPVGLTGLEEFKQRFQNTTFGAFDFGILGNQLKAALDRGGVPYMLGLINKGASALGHPLMPAYYAATNTPKILQYAIDGVPQNISTGAIEGAKDVGTLFRYGIFGGNTRVGKAVDKVISTVAEKNSNAQFGTIMGHARNTTYEGGLLMEHLLGRDITDATVRAKAARMARTSTSFAYQATSGKRGMAERLTQVSSSMMRSRFAHVAQMAQFLNPKASAEDRIMASGMIASSVLSYLTTVKAVDAIWGTGDAETDPTKPGFGNVTLEAKDSKGRNIVVDMMPQDSVKNAFAQSLRNIANEDPQAFAKTWAKVFLGGSSVYGRAGAAALGTGYAPGRGYRFGDLTPTEAVLNIAPIPPVFGEAIQNLDPAYIGANAVGTNAYPESAIAQAQRLSNDQFTTMAGPDRAQFLADKPELAANLRADAQAQGGRIADIQNATDTLNESYKGIESSDLQGKALRDELGSAQDRFSGAMENIDQRYGKSESKATTAEQKAWSEYKSALVKSATNGVDWETTDAARAALRDSWTPEQKAYVDRLTGMTDPNLPPRIKALKETQKGLDTTGFFDLRNQAWTDFQAAHPQQLAGVGPDYYKWRDAQVREETQNYIAQGYAPEMAALGANDKVGGYKTVSAFNEFYRTEYRHQWVVDHPELALKAAAAGYFNPDKQETVFLAERSRRQ